jgi:hypothetical protein
MVEGQGETWPLGPRFQLPSRRRARNFGTLITRNVYRCRRKKPVGCICGQANLAASVLLEDEHEHEHEDEYEDERDRSGARVDGMVAPVPESSL